MTYEEAIRVIESNRPTIGIVQICEEDFTRLYGVCIKLRDGSGVSLLKSKIDFIVIGNIYDNPEK